MGDKSSIGQWIPILRLSIRHALDKKKTQKKILEPSKLDQQTSAMNMTMY